MHPSPHRIGTLLATLRKDHAHIVLGYPSPHDMLVGERLVSRATASKHITVARAFGPKTLDALGMTKAYAIVRYAEVADAPHTPAQLVARDATLGKKKISESSVRDIERATAALRARATPTPRELTRIARDLERTLTERGATAPRVTPRLLDHVWTLELHLLPEDAPLLTR